MNTQVICMQNDSVEDIEDICEETMSYSDDEETYQM